MKRRTEDCFICNDIKTQELESEIIKLRSDNMFLYAVIDQIEAACNSTMVEYNKDLKEVISIILSPFATDKLDEEETEDAE